MEKPNALTAHKPAATNPKPLKSVHWSFELSDDAPNSQPFWDHSNEYSKYIASMVAAMVTALPNIPMQTAIAMAIDTVKAAGPSILNSTTKDTASTKAKRAPSSKHPATTLEAPAPTRPRSPAAGKTSGANATKADVTAKGTKAAPIDVASPSPATATFAQMAASILSPPTDCLHDAIKAAIPPNSANSIAILNKPPTTTLKFMTVPRHNEDGSDTDSYDLYNHLIAHELWRDVKLFSQPRFLPMKPDAAGGTVIVSIVDDNQGTIGRKLMNTVVTFSGASRCCLRWVEKEAQLFCTQCQCWGHLNYNCLSNVMHCSKCAGLHDYKQHDRFCNVCKAGKGHLCLPKCHNCRGAHFANSKDCIFYLNRSSKERQVQLRDKFSQKWKEEAAALKAAANTDSGRAARANIASKLDKSEAKGKSKAKPGAKVSTKDDDDFVPVGKGRKAKYTFGGMTRVLTDTTHIEEVVEGNDDGNDSDASSDLRLSYLDDVPLKQRFPELKLPTTRPVVGPAPTSAPPLPIPKKPLTITLPAPKASKHQPLCSVTDILRELKNPASAPIPVVP
ncbi:hypothetical protein AX14_007693, partial [Amanita brunnescens Koide BX004]